MENTRSSGAVMNAMHERNFSEGGIFFNPLCNLLKLEVF
jgi:hypothetical protein